MEKLGTPSNRLTRSSARSTPRKREDISDANSEELKSIPRKSRRKTDTNSKTNGDTSTDVDSKNMRNFEEISDGNSLDSVESNVTLKHKLSPRPKSHKTPSPTISKKSLRTRRSVTPGPEVETSITRKITRSTSEGKLDSVGTPTRRSIRARSESKDFTFTPSKHFDSVAEFTVSESASKCIPITSLNVINEIIDEDNEVEPSTSLKTTPEKISNLEITISDSSDPLVLNSGQDTHISPEVDDKQLPSQVINENAYSNNQDSNESSIIVVDYSCPVKINKSPLNDNPIIDNNSINQEDFVSKDESKPFSVSDVLNKAKDQVPLLEKTECAEDELPLLQVAKSAQKQLRSLEKTDTAEDQLPILEKTESAEDKLPLLENPEPVEDKLPLLENPEPVEDKLPLLENPEPVEDKLPLLKTPEPVEDKLPLLKTPEPVEDKLPLLENPEPVEEQLLLLEKAKSAEDTSCDKTETLKIVTDESIKEERAGFAFDDHVRNPPVEIINVVEYDTKIKTFNESDQTQNVHSDKSDNITLHTDNLLQTNQTDDVNKNVDEISQANHKKSQSLPITQLSDDESNKTVVIDNVTTIDKTHLEVPASSSDNISVTENNNVSMVLEMQSDDVNVDNRSKETMMIDISKHTTDHTETTIILGSQRCEDEESIVVCCSDSEEHSDIEESHDITENEEVDCEQTMQPLSSNCNEMESAVCNEIESNVIISDEMDDYNSMVGNDGTCSTQVKEAQEDNKTNIINDNKGLNKCSEEESLMNDVTETHSNEINTCKQTECNEDVISSQQHEDSNIKEKIQGSYRDDEEKTIVELKDDDEETIVELKDDEEETIVDLKDDEEAIVDMKDEEENQEGLFNKSDSKENVIESSVDETLVLGNESDDKLKESNESESLEDKTVNRDSDSESELYKDMSDFGSDGKSSQSGGDSDSSELKSGDSEEYGSSLEGEEDEVENTKNEEKVISNDQDSVENVQKINPKVEEKIFDTSSPMTYDKALAILNKDRVKKIDDEEFFDMFTEELNKVSGDSGSDSDIAIVDEYIAEPEEQGKPKSNQKRNPKENLKSIQQSAPSNSKQTRPLPSKGKFNKQAPTTIKMSLKTSQRQQSDIPTNSMQENFSGAYNNQQFQTDYNHQSMARMDFSQGGMYEEYNSAMPGGHAMYDQFAPNMQDQRMYASYDSYNRGGMYAPLGPIADEQNQYLSGPLKVRSMDSMCETNPNAMNYNSTRPISENRNQNQCKENDGNMIMGVSTATMTETNDPTDQALPFKSSSKNDGSILSILGLDRKKLKMLKKALGLNNSRAKERNKIKQVLIDEVKKMGINLKSAGHTQRKEPSEAKYTGKKKRFIKEIVDSDSSFNSSEQSCSEYSVALASKENQSSSCGSTKGESSNESEAGKRKINLASGCVSVTIDTRQKNKMRHRLTRYNPAGNKKNLNIKKRKRALQRKWDCQSESSEDENIKRLKKKTKKLTNAMHMFSETSNMKKMVQGKSDGKKKSKLLQSKLGTFTVDPVTATSQSESDTFSHDETKDYLAEFKQNVKRDLAAGKNKLSNMFTQHTLRREGKKGRKRKAAYELSEQATKSKRLSADVLANLGIEKKTKKQDDDQSQDGNRSQDEDQLQDSGPDERLSRKIRKPRKRLPKNLKVPSAAMQNDYIPLVVNAGPSEFSLKRLDKEGILSTAEQAAKFRSDRLYGTSVKRITSQELLNVKKKQQRNDLISERERKKAVKNNS